MTADDPKDAHIEIQDRRGRLQANVAGGLPAARLGFWIAVIATGVLAGLGADAMMAILRFVQHGAFSYHSGSYSAAVSRHSDLRRLVVLAAGGAITGPCLWALRLSRGGTGGEPTEVVWTRSGILSLPRTLATGAVSEVSVGLGASIGREAAPQRLGAAVGYSVAGLAKLSPSQRRLLVACGAGAGLGAVYNVPFAGALFAAELYLDDLSLEFVVAALAASALATATSWVYLPRGPVYRIALPASASGSVVAFALLAGPIFGLFSAGYVRLVAWASDHRPKGRALLVEPLVVFLLLGVLAFRYPLLLGNGVDLASWAFSANRGIAMLVALGLLKPLVTAACLRSGATGGLFTPTLSTGAVLGALAGQAWLAIWPGHASPAFAVIGAGAVLAGAIEAPATAVAMTLELTRGLGVAVGVVLAATGATLVSRRIEPRSIYSARLAQIEPTEVSRPHKS